MSVGRSWSRRGKGSEPREGDPRCLSIRLDCLARECEVLGLVKSAPMIVQQAVTTTPSVVPMTPAERWEAVIALLTAASREGGPNSEAGRL